MYQPEKDIFKISSSISFTNQLINSNFALYLNRFFSIRTNKQQKIYFYSFKKGIRQQFGLL
ncbi:hypothetical protein D7322_17700 [Sphingobacterium puteale]|uniref:Uncharacterized protein n=1 Tax=Sphingobacterium puteale TaxID=2420510 RepID=A0A420VVE2_9SPHI|nr:hypothetical protein D7322_17700 [Sphingobacterium puteale]